MAEGYAVVMGVSCVCRAAFLVSEGLQMPVGRRASRHTRAARAGTVVRTGRAVIASQQAEVLCASQPPCCRPSLLRRLAIERERRAVVGRADACARPRGAHTCALSCQLTQTH
jgi:hypothetical protein